MNRYQLHIPKPKVVLAGEEFISQEHVDIPDDHGGVTHVKPGDLIRVTHADRDNVTIEVIPHE